MPKKGPDPSKRAKIIAVLEKNPDGVWMRELARLSGLPFSTVQYYVTHLLSGEVEIQELASMARTSPIKIVKIKSQAEPQQEKKPRGKEKTGKYTRKTTEQEQAPKRQEDHKQPSPEGEDPLQIIATFIKDNIITVRELAKESRELRDKATNATSAQDLESVIRQARDCREKIEEIEIELDRLLENLRTGAKNE